jgi:CTP:molybdopterin cytidylyltransferase MocA
MRGPDKLLEEVDGIALLRRQCLRALETGCPVLVTLPALDHPRRTVLAGLPVQMVEVRNADEGMNASLRAGLRACGERTEALMVVLADMPDLTTDDMNIMLQAADLKSETLIWRAVTASGDAGHPIIFHKQLFPDIMALHGDAGAREVVARHGDVTARIPLPGDHARTDLDTPEAWAAWRATRGAT